MNAVAWVFVGLNVLGAGLAALLFGHQQRVTRRWRAVAAEAQRGRRVAQARLSRLRTVQLGARRRTRCAVCSSPRPAAVVSIRRSA